MPGLENKPAKLALRGLRKHFGLAGAAVEALDGIDLEIADQAFVCIVGPSGCGKTTLLRILAGLELPSAGSIDIRQDDAARPLTAMVFQENAIFPWMTVRQNIAFGLAVRRRPAREIAPVVDRFLALTGLAAFADAYPHQLSGGMKQRTSVARAFANDPEILLMDEPFAALDEQTRIVLQDELLRLWGSARKTVLFITHSIDEAIALSDRVLVMSGRPGRLKADIAIPFARPRTVHALKADPEFGRLWHRIWELLRDAPAPGAAA
jgi:NitT/TauT family transport system ATP-binding protein